MSLLEKLIARMTRARDSDARRVRSGEQSLHNLLTFHSYDRPDLKGMPQGEDVAIQSVARLPPLHTCSKVASLPLQDPH